MATAYLALGSNLGNRLQYLRKARQALSNTSQIKVTNISAIYETAPYGGVKQGAFLNAVMQVETQLTPADLLKVCHDIEKRLERKRTIHWGPRTIDIDILLYDQLKVQTADLMIPHPEIIKRSFVLIPLQDVYPKQPLLGRPLIDWIQKSGNQEDVKVSDLVW